MSSEGFANVVEKIMVPFPWHTVISLIGLSIGIFLFVFGPKIAKSRDTWLRTRKISPTKEQKRVLRELLGPDTIREVKRKKVKAKPKIKKEKESIFVELVSIGKTISTHVTRRFTPSQIKKGLKFTLNEKTVDIEQKHFFLRKLGIGKRIKNKLRGIKHSFMVFIDEESGDPFIYKGPTVSSDALYIVHESTSLSRALKEMFASKLPAKKLIFVIIAVAVITVLILFLLPQIQSGGFKF